MPDAPLPAGFVDDPYAGAVETIVARTSLSSAPSVADLGAGDGSFARLLRASMAPFATLLLVDRELPATVDEPSMQCLQADLARDDPACQVDLAVARFLLVQSDAAAALVVRLAAWLRPGGTLVLMEPITSTGRVGHSTISADPSVIPNPDAGLELPRLIGHAGLELTSLDAITPVGLGSSSVGGYLARLTDSAPLPDELVLLPCLVVAVGRLNATEQSPPAQPN